jgi:DNA-binding response OmpR family regulator
MFLPQVAIVECKRGDGMSGTVFLAAWDRTAARDRAAQLRARGWHVEWEATSSWQAYASIRRQPPDAVVIDLEHEPAHGRELGRSLRYGSALRELPLVFVGGEARDRELARKAVDGALFARPAELDEALAGVADRRRVEAWPALPM